MKKIRSVLLLFLSAFGAWSGPISQTFYCYHQGNRYEFTITLERQKKCPQWDPLVDENPPYSAAKALREGRKWISKIDPDQGHVWKLEEISLIEAWGWTWRVRFDMVGKGQTMGPPHFMDCYILMDGTVVQPLITPVPTNKIGP